MGNADAHDILVEGQSGEALYHAVDIVGMQAEGFPNLFVGDLLTIVFLDIAEHPVDGFIAATEFLRGQQPGALYQNICQNIGAEAFVV